MIDPLEVASAIFSLSKSIHDSIQTIRDNSKACERLGRAVNIATSNIEGLKGQYKNYEAALVAYQECLEECHMFIIRFAKKPKAKRYLKANKYKNRMIELNQQVLTTASLLNLGLTAQQQVDREKERLQAEIEKEIADATRWEAEQQHREDLQQFRDEMLQEIQANRMLDTGMQQKQVESLELQFQEASAPPLSQFEGRPLLKEELMIPLYELKELFLITNEGTWGNVYRAQWDDQTVAVKMLAGVLTEQELDHFVREVEILSRLHSDYIVPLYGACLEPGRACLVTRYMEKGSLNQFLKNETLNIDQRLSMAIDITSGLRYLHNKDIWHRHFKSSNVLIDANYRAKISDLRFAKIQTPLIKTAQLDRKAGAWTAPECFEDFEDKVKYSATSDVYSLGVVLWELFTGQTPFESESEHKIRQRILNKEREIIYDSIPEPLQNLIEHCWAQDPNKRPTCGKILDTLKTYQAERLAAQESEAKARAAEEKYRYARNIEKQAKSKNDSEEQQGDYQIAFQNYKMASDMGSLKAKACLAMLFLVGKGTVSNKAKAFQLLMEAAQDGKGDIVAMINLAWMYEHGKHEKNEKPNLPRALFWLEQAKKREDMKPEAKRFIQEKAQKLRDQNVRPSVGF